MKYFAGLDFSLAGSFRDYSAHHRHRPTYYGLQYNHSGGLRLRVDEGPVHQVEGAYAFLTHPGALFEYGPGGSNLRHHSYICFHGPRVERYRAGGLFPLDAASPLIPVARPERFLSAMQETISLIFAERDYHDRAVLRLEELLLQLQEHEPVAEECHQTPFLAALASEIRLQPEKAWDFGRISAELNVSETHFRRLFKRFCGQAPQQYLIEQRLRRAARLLSEGRELVKNVAAQVGIDNEFYFSRLFKRKFRLAPADYRREFAGTALGPE